MHAESDVTAHACVRVCVCVCVDTSVRVVVEPMATASALIQQMEGLQALLDRGVDGAARLLEPRARSIATKIGVIRDLSDEDAVLLMNAAESILGDFAQVVTDAVNSRIAASAAAEVAETSAKQQILTNPPGFLTQEDWKDLDVDSPFHVWCRTITGRLQNIGVWAPHEKTRKAISGLLVYLYFRKHDSYPSTSEIYDWSLMIKRSFPNARDKAMYDSGVVTYPDSADDLPKAVLDRYRADDPPVVVSIPELAGICKHRVRVRSSANGVKQHCKTRAAIDDPDGNVTKRDLMRLLTSLQGRNGAICDGDDIRIDMASPNAHRPCTKTIIAKRERDDNDDRDALGELIAARNQLSRRRMGMLPPSRPNAAAEHAATTHDGGSTSANGQGARGDLDNMRGSSTAQASPRGTSRLSTEPRSHRGLDSAAGGYAPPYALEHGPAAPLPDGVARVGGDSNVKRELKAEGVDADIAPGYAHAVDACTSGSLARAAAPSPPAPAPAPHAAASGPPPGVDASEWYEAQAMAALLRSKEQKKIDAAAAKKAQADAKKAEQAAGIPAKRAGKTAVAAKATLKRPAACTKDECDDSPKAGKYALPSKAAQYESGDFSDLIAPIDMPRYASEGSWTSKAYKTVLYHTGNQTTAKRAYKEAADVWAEHHP